MTFFRRICLLTLLLTGLTSATFAQLGKMQFEDAEEQFAAGRFEETLSLLEQSEKSLGATNPMISHLRIMARVELLKQDAVRYIDMLETAKEEARGFLAKYDGDTQIEEKYREVYKASKVLATFPTKSDIEKKKAGEAQKKAEEEAERIRFEKQALVPGYRHGMTTAQLEKMRPGLLSLFKSDSLRTVFFSDLKLTVYISPVTDRTFGCKSTTFYHKSDEKFTEGMTAYNSKKAEITEKIGFGPVEGTPEHPSAKALKIQKVLQCTWTDGTRTVELRLTCQQFKRKYIATLSISDMDPKYK